MNTRAYGDGVLARAERQGALAPDVRLLDRPAGEEGPRDADDAEDDLLFAWKREC